MAKEGVRLPPAGELPGSSAGITLILQFIPLLILPLYADRHLWFVIPFLCLNSDANVNLRQAIENMIIQGGHRMGPPSEVEIPASTTGPRSMVGSVKSGYSLNSGGYMVTRPENFNKKGKDGKIMELLTNY